MTTNTWPANPPPRRKAYRPAINAPQELGLPKRVVWGGSFLCHASYCAGYRVSACMKGLARYGAGKDRLSLHSH
jgi:hypothetical protein